LWREQHGVALFAVGGDEIGPPLREFVVDLARFGAQ
jgi:hypothetical protein